MANINDFKIINARSINKFKQAAKELSGEHLISELDETKQARLGFYFLTLEAITGISDFKILVKCVPKSKIVSSSSHIAIPISKPSIIIIAIKSSGSLLPKYSLTYLKIFAHE